MNTFQIELYDFRNNGKIKENNLRGHFWKIAPKVLNFKKKEE